MAESVHVPRRRSTPLAAPPKRALLIGINYANPPEGSGYSPLQYARSDTKSFRDLLIRKYDYRPENIVMMLDEERIDPCLLPTRTNILREIRELMHAVRAGSRLTFFCAFFLLAAIPVPFRSLSSTPFSNPRVNASIADSGHSGQIESLTNEEDDGFDEFIVPVDHWKGTIGGTEGETTRNRLIIDNELRRLLVDTLPAGSYLTAFFDSCHSRTLLDLDHYHCNSVYRLWHNSGARRYRTLWQQVDRKNGLHMSQSDILKENQRPDSKVLVGSDSSQASLRGRRSERIYQDMGISADQVEVVKATVSVSKSRDGKRRHQSGRSSLQRRTGSSFAQVMEGGMQSTELVDDGEVWGRRCASPISDRPCGNFCAIAEKPSYGGDAMSLSACDDSQQTYESNQGTFTQWLVYLLDREPHQSIGKLYETLRQKMYERAQQRHAYSQKRKASWTLKNPPSKVDRPSDLDIVAAPFGETAETRKLLDPHLNDHHPLDRYDFSNVEEPQLGAQQRLNLERQLML